MKSHPILPVYKIPDEPTKKYSRYSVPLSCPAGGRGLYNFDVLVDAMYENPDDGGHVPGNGSIQKSCPGTLQPLPVTVNIPYAKSAATADATVDVSLVPTAALQQAPCLKADDAPDRYQVEISTGPDAPERLRFALHVVVFVLDEVIGTWTGLVGWPSTLPLVIEVPVDAQTSAMPKHAECIWYWLPLL